MRTVSATNFSDQIRDRAVSAYIEPARKSGKKSVSIAVRDLMGKFPEFADGRQSIFCSALIAKPFLRTNGLKLEATEGPAKKRGTNVVYHFKLQPVTDAERDSIEPADAEHFVEKLLAPLKGLLTKEIAAHGGVDGYMRWVRSDESAG